MRFLKDLKTKEADYESAEKLTSALDSANKNYKDLMESKEKLSFMKEAQLSKVHV